MLVNVDRQVTAVVPFSQMPLVSGLPVLGSAIGMFLNPISFFNSTVDRYGRLHRLRLAGKEVVCIHSADNLETMLLTDAASYNRSEHSKKITFPLLGDFLGTTTDMVYWSNLRKMLQPMFTPKMLQSYFDGTVEAVQNELSLLGEACTAGREIEMNSFVREGVFLALAKTLFKDGLPIEAIPGFMAEYDKIAPYMATRYLLGESALVELLPQARRGRQALDAVNSQISKLIETRRQESREHVDDMLDAIIMARDEDGSSLSDEAVRHNVMGLFFGGQETTPGTIMWAFGLLAEHPDKRDKLLNEIDSVLNGRLPTFADLANLEYASMVIDETLRLYPMFPYLERVAIKDTVMDGFSIPSGTTMYIVASTTQRDPANFSEPDKFIPERHSKEQKRERIKKSKCAMVPFGYGQRRCIGERVGRLEAMLTLVMILQKYRLEHVSGHIPASKMFMSPKPKGGMHMRIYTR
jgi:cytochrome P450